MNNKTKILIFVGLITIVMVVQFFMPHFGQTHIIRMEPTGDSVSYPLDAGPSFHSNNSNLFYFVTRGGVQQLASNGGVRWSEPFSFTHPIMVARGDIVAVGERAGRTVYVFNSAGLIFSADFDDPVVLFSVNEAGILSVVLETSFGYRIYIHNQQSVRPGERALFYQNITGDLHFPTAVEVSENGRYIAVAILDSSTSLFNHTILLRYMNEWDARAAGVEEGLFAAEILDDQEVIYSMRFMADNKFVVATTSRIICYQITSRSYGVSTKQILWAINLQNYLSHIAFYGNRHLVYVTGDRHLGIIDGTPPGAVRIVNLDSTQVGEFNLGRSVTHLSVGHGAAIVGTDRNFHAIDLRGNLLWEHNALQYTRDVIFLDDTDTILIAGANRAEVHVRRRMRNNTIEEILD